ncbi:MAG TPA: hypothetical protein DEA08_22200 [Planctomycetes bacterium]|nr:hypothetical protein [Planctomycetota bacterium]
MTDDVHASPLAPHAEEEPTEAEAALPPESSLPAVSVSDLAFVLQVLIPRAYVRGREVDALLELRTKLEEILERVGHDPAA